MAYLLRFARRSDYRANYFEARYLAAAFGGGQTGFLYDHRGMPMQWQDSAGTTPAVAGQPIGRVTSRNTGGLVVTGSGSARPSLAASPRGAAWDGFDDVLAGASGGGGTAGFFWCGAVQPNGNDGVTQALFSDRGVNTGFNVFRNTDSTFRMQAGNGAAYISTASAGVLAAGSRYVATAWYEGTNLNAQVNLNTPVSIAMGGPVSAGEAAFSLGKRHGSATQFLYATVFGQTYTRNVCPDAATRLLAQQLMAQWAGVTL